MAQNAIAFGRGELVISLRSLFLGQQGSVRLVEAIFLFGINATVFNTLGQRAKKR
jgi:hypothetical protein